VPNAETRGLLTGCSSDASPDGDRQKHDVRTYRQLPAALPALQGADYRAITSIELMLWSNGMPKPK
jgi:hypothetical protein